MAGGGVAWDLENHLPIQVNKRLTNNKKCDGYLTILILQSKSFIHILFIEL